MRKKYKILHLEDVAADAELIARELLAKNISFEHFVVDSEIEYVKALENFSPDIILSDHSLPNFNSFDAFRILKEHKLNIPFIIITATLTEEVAVNMVRQGVDDYILKDRIKRLPHALLNALEKCRFEKERKILIDQVYQKEAISKELLSQLSSKVLLATKAGGIGIWEYLFTENKFVADDIMLQQFGLTPESFNGSLEELMQYVHPEDKDIVISEFQKSFINYSDVDIEYRIIWNDGSVHFVKAFAVVQLNHLHKPSRLIGTNQDITVRRNAEIEKEFERIDKEALINSTEDMMWTVSNSFKLIAANKAFINNMKDLTGIDLKPGDDLMRKDIFPEDTLSFWKDCYQTPLRGELLQKEIYAPHLNGREASWIDTTFNPIYKNNVVASIACYSRNITDRKLAELQLTESYAKYKAIIDNSMGAFLLTDNDGNILEVNATTCQTLGYTNDELLKLNRKDIIEVDSPDFQAAVDMKNKTGVAAGEVYGIRKTGERFPISFTTSVFYTATGEERLSSIGMDITEKKKGEEKILKSNERFLNVSKATFDAIWDWDVHNNYLYLGDGFTELFGYESTNGSSKFSTWSDHIHPEDKERVLTTRLNKIIHHDELNWTDNYRYLRADGSVAYVSDRGILLRNKTGTYRMIGAMQDITRLKQEEQRMLEVLKEKNSILESIGDAFFAVDRDWTVTYWNNQAEKMLQTLKKDILGHNLWDVFSGSIDSESYRKYHEAVETNTVIHFEDYYAVLKTWFEISAYPSDTGLSVYFKDVTARKLSDIHMAGLNESLAKQAKKLAVSNAELERYAYVTSHDLQEPLRMVTSFLQLLQKKYDSQLDVTAQKYINFAVEGAARMKTLILDLLEFSRISSVAEDHKVINLNDVISKTRLALRTAIDESDAVFNVSFLPQVCGNESQLLQLFQNLISNSIKYKDGLKPVIDISYTETGVEWKFCVADNGIGIDEKFFDKIFIIFQRLHNKKEYEGTGIGLAISKKIVELHGGKIWVESVKGKGSKFYFTILKLQTSNITESEILCPDIAINPKNSV